MWLCKETYNRNTIVCVSIEDRRRTFKPKVEQKKIVEAYYCSCLVIKKKRKADHKPQHSASPQVKIPA